MSKVYTHGGSAGDVIYHLAPVKDNGGGEVWINTQTHPHWRMPPDRIESLCTLLRVQPYITACGACEGVRGFNLDDWRRHWREGFNLCDMVSEWFGIPHTDRLAPWLTVPSVRRIAPVVMHRSPRYHTGFPWPTALEKYGRDAVFVGHPSEHADFVQRFGPVSYWHTADYLELAQVIAGADLFIGNQSSPAAVAQGLRKTMVQETVPRNHWAWNCHWQRPGMFHSDGSNVDLPDLRIARYLTHTVLTEAKLLALRQQASACAALTGDFAELGCWRGGSARAIADSAPGKALHLFDTFAGLPSDEVLPGGHRAGEFRASLDEVRAYLDGYPIEYHVGYFPDSAAGLDGPFAFVHLDGDLYQSTKDAIAFFWPRMVRGGCIVFDDWLWPECPGVEKAIREAGLAVEETASCQCLVRKE